MPTVVVAALSARQLALSARRAGWDVMALDLFGDVDTRAAARQWMQIGDAEAMQIDGARLLEALQSAAAELENIGWIAGAGFERRPALLEEGAHILPLIGNGRAVTEQVRDARRFFAALDELAIPHPPTRLTLPEDARGWLVKDFASSGGWHVRHLSLPRFVGEGGRGVHYQREISGRPMSLLFIADGKRALPVAINALLVRALGDRPYVYHGAIGPITDLPTEVPDALARAADALVDALQLHGLGSLDVLVDADTIQVLELNARPTATLALYDAEVPSGLVHAHVEACNGRLPAHPFPIETRRIRGEATVFAAHGCAITQQHVTGLTQLECRDIPRPGSHVPAAAPLCTVAAEGATVAQVHEQLAAREAAVLALVQNQDEASRHAE